jgi:inosine/xanthosine triphosphate pyrophosphatase family protein
MRLIAATRNRAKTAQLARLVAGLADVEPLPAVGEDPAEDGESFEEIAIAKAAAWSARLDRGELVVATDGGLLIPALGDRWDPVRTRRFAGGTSDLARAEALLELTHDLTGEQRRILWQEALAVARDGAVLASWVATSKPGLLAQNVDPAAIAAGQGFWVPALWICPECGGRRLTELSPEELAARPDHWRRLGADLRALLRGLNR